MSIHCTVDKCEMQLEAWYPYDNIKIITTKKINAGMNDAVY